MLTCQQCGKKKDQKARLSGTSVSTDVESQSSSVEVFNPLREETSAAVPRMFGNRGAKSSPAKPNPNPHQDSPPISAEAAAVLLQLSKLSLEQQQQVIRMTSGVSNTPEKPKSASGLYQDPRTGKQYRLKKPKRRSKQFQQAETLVKTALAELQEWTHTNGCTFAREDKSLLKEAKPFTPTGKALEEYDLLLHALANARKQLKAVKETEKSRGPKKGKSLDPKRMPVFKPDTRSWADLEEDK